MERLSAGGYTLLEVMLFLAISTVIFTLSIVVVRGQAGDNEFRTSVDDITSKFQQWIDEVQNGSSSNPSDASNSTLQCSTITESGKSYPHLITGSGSERGSNQSCILLGKAILLNSQTNNDSIEAIPVVGLRTDGSGNLVNTIKDSHPIAALNQGPNSVSEVDLSETYKIPNGTRLSSVKDSTSSCGSGSYLGGFFTNLDTTNANGGAESLVAAQYPYCDDNSTIASSDPTSTAVAGCIMLQTAGSNNCDPGALSNLWQMGNWQLCFTNSRTSDYAEVNINSSGGLGATLHTTFGKGSPVCP